MGSWEPDMKPKGIPIQRVAKILEKGDDMNGGTKYMSSSDVVWRNKYQRVKEENESLRKKIVELQDALFAARGRMYEVLNEAYDNGVKDTKIALGVKND